MDAWTDRLSDYLDDALAAEERAALETHLAGCTACAATLDELRRVVARARGLDDRPPAADLWPGIAERIGVTPDVVSLPARRRARRFTFSAGQLAAAAVLLVIAGSGGAYLALHRGGSGGSVARRSSPPVSYTIWLANATASQDSAVADLRVALEASRRTGGLDSATVRVVEQSLATIDSAIVQAQRALAADPGSAYLSQHLAETLRRKSELVRRAGTLVTARL
jgi:putative zinc finger protein